MAVEAIIESIARGAVPAFAGAILGVVVAVWETRHWQKPNQELDRIARRILKYLGNVEEPDVPPSPRRRDQVPIGWLFLMSSCGVSGRASPWNSTRLSNWVSNRMGATGSPHGIEGSFSSRFVSSSPWPHAALL